MSTETISLRETITPKTEKWIRVSAVLAMLIVASSSAILSFDGLQKVALASRVPQNLAFLFPIAVDTTILMGSLAVLLYELVGVRSVFGWFTVMFGTVLSVTGNVISVSDAGIIAQVLHGIIPVLLCISLESLLRILRFNIKRSNKAHAEYDKGTRGELEEPATSEKEQPLAQEVPAVAQEPVIPVTPKTLGTDVSTVAEVSEKVESVSLPADSAPMPAQRQQNAIQEATPAPVETPSSEPAILSETIAEPVVAAEQESETAPEPVVETQPAEDPAPTVEDKPAETPEPVKKPARKTPAKRAPRKPAAKAEPVAKKTAAKDPVTPKKEPAPLVPKNVATYKSFLEGLDENLDRNQKAREIRKAYPKATVTDIKAAILS
ncbi:MAG: DUF2637 domain-containing protein [Enterococcus sp.]|nr:DUF2637 domain-containing protein [Enterococcus sp.]